MDLFTATLEGEDCCSAHFTGQKTELSPRTSLFLKARPLRRARVEPRLAPCPAPLGAKLSCGVLLTRSAVSDSLRPRGLKPSGLLCPWDSPGKSTGVGCHALLQGIFPTQELNPGLVRCRQILYHLSHQVSCHRKGQTMGGVVVLNAALRFVAFLAR